MEKIRINCPKCTRRIKVTEKHFGRKISCPNCTHNFVAQDPDAPTEAPAKDPKKDEDLIRFNCPNCERILKSGREFAGQKMQCPSCNTNINVPGEKKSKKSLRTKGPSKKSKPAASAAPGPKTSGRQRPVRKAREKKSSLSPGFIIANVVGLLLIGAVVILLAANDWDIEKAIAAVTGKSKPTSVEILPDSPEEEKKKKEEERKKKEEEEKQQLAEEKRKKEEAEKSIKEDTGPKVIPVVKKTPIDEEEEEDIGIDPEELKKMKEESLRKRREQALEIAKQEQEEEEFRKVLAEKEKELLAKNKDDENSGEFPEGVDLLQPPKDPFFKEELHSLLKNRCFKCHGREKSKGDFRMHTRKDMLKGGEQGDAIVIGDPDKSLLIQLVSLPEDDDDIMPPKGSPLKEKEIEKLKKWIKGGAKW